MAKQALVQRQIDELLAKLGDDAVATPKRLTARVRKALKADPAQSWDEALRLIVEDTAPGD
jgi:hypothetical protein